MLLTISHENILGIEDVFYVGDDQYQDVGYTMDLSKIGDLKEKNFIKKISDTCH